MSTTDGKKFGNRVGFSGLFTSPRAFDYPSVSRYKSKILTTRSCPQEKTRDPPHVVYNILQHNITMTSLYPQKNDYCEPINAQVRAARCFKYETQRSNVPLVVCSKFRKSILNFISPETPILIPTQFSIPRPFSWFYLFVLHFHRRGHVKNCSRRIIILLDLTLRAFPCKLHTCNSFVRD